MCVLITLCTQIIREERKPKSANGLKLVAEDEEEEETAPEKRLRLAKEYIAQVEEEGMYLCPLSCDRMLTSFSVVYCRDE